MWDRVIRSRTHGSLRSATRTPNSVVRQKERIRSVRTRLVLITFVVVEIGSTEQKDRETSRRNAAGRRRV
jgi:hypothetical protein